MTLAPELPGADALIERLRERGVAVAAGHTNATAAEANHAFDLGVGGVTHVFNAMRPFRSRDPGIAGAALTRASVVIGMVVDGHHLADETVRLDLVVRGRPRRARHRRDGGGRNRRQRRHLPARRRRGGRRRRRRTEREDGTLAGSVLTMIDAGRNLHALGVPFEQAVGAATEVPARFLARGDVGFLEPGAPADVVVLDDRLEIPAPFSARGGAMSWLETELREQPEALARLLERQTAVGADRRAALPPARPPLPPDRISGQLLERRALRAVPPRAGPPGPGHVRDPIPVHDLRPAPASGRCCRDRDLAIGRLAGRGRRPRRGPGAGTADAGAHERRRVAAREDGRGRPAVGGRARSTRSLPRRPTSTPSGPWPFSSPSSGTT